MGGKVAKGKPIEEKSIKPSNSAAKFPLKKTKEILSARDMKTSVETSATPISDIQAKQQAVSSKEELPSLNRSKSTLKVNISPQNAPSRHAGKKQKILIESRKDDLKQEMASEYDILEVIARNNYENIDYDLIEVCILNHFFMRSLEKQARNEIIREMTLCKIKKGLTLFKQGSIGYFFYIVKSGDLDLFIQNTLVKTFTLGNSFGELALLHGSPRSGTVVAKTDSLVWCMERRNFRKIIDHINSINFEENMKFIKTINIFSNMGDELKTILAKNLMKVFFSRGESVVKAGDISSCLYIIKEGEVECQSQGKSVRTLTKGDHFGEKSLMLECPRTMDVIAVSDCVLYSISVETLKNMVGERYIEVLTFNFLQMAFANSKNFSRINPKLLENSFHIFQLKNYERGEIVISYGHILGSMVHIIIEGSVYNKKLNRHEGKRGDILFENNLCSYDSEATHSRLSYDLYADPDCLVLSVETKEFMKYLGGSLKDIFKKSHALSSLNKIPVFKNLSQRKLSYLSSVITVQKFENGKRIITQGETGDKFYIIKSGRVEIYKDGKYIRTFNENESFGFRALFFNEPRSATVQANGKVELYVLSAKDFNGVLEEKMISYLKNKILLEDDSIALKDLDYIRDLGSGNFGTVSLVRSRKNKCMYAIKAMSKLQIDYNKLHQNIELERAILLKVEHPFITKFVKSMKDDSNIFFLMEYIRGKELWEAIRDIGLLDKFQTQFYSASIMLALDYLHEKKCVHRDIKPENVMVLENGYIKLIDFGTCKEIIDRTSTIIGTPHYMAPEAILAEGYSFAIDFWSIGVCMYEFMCGGVPFGEGVDDPMEVYKLVVQCDLKFPSFAKDKEFIDIEQKMLAKSPMSRLCNFTQIRAHPWFNGFSFEALLNFDIEPPYKSQIPEIDKPGNIVPYLNHIPEIKKFKPQNDKKIDQRDQEKYDQWFDNF